MDYRTPAIHLSPLAGYQLARLIKAGHEIDAPTIKPAKPYLALYLIQNGKKVAALDGTAMAANPGITNTLGGSGHGLTYEPLARFITQCMAVSGS